MTLFEDPKYSRHKWLFVAGGLLCLFLAFSLTALFGGRFAPPETPKENPAEFETLEESAVSTNRWVIYITGAVMRPGVYEVPAGARVNDALQKAGGFSLHADPEAVNLAAKIEDGAHIRVPEKGEAPKEGPGAVPALSPGAPPSRTSTPATDPGQATGKVDINRASTAELQYLPGIGPKLSQAIVDYREVNGPFKAAEDLKNVRGIGEKRFEAIRDFITTSQ